MGGQPSDAHALSPPSPLQQGGQSSNAPALSPPSPLPQGSQPIALALSPSSPLPQDGQPSDAPGLSPSSSTLLLCPSDSTLSICHLNSQSAVKTGKQLGSLNCRTDEECVDETVCDHLNQCRTAKEGRCRDRPGLCLTGAYCVWGTCHCNPYVTHVQSPKCGLETGQACRGTRRDQCRLGTLCDVDHICQLRLGADCRDDVECPAGAQCTLGLCRCTEAVSTPVGHTCVANAGLVGGSCTQGQCRDPRAQCSRDTAACRCGQGYGVNTRLLTCGILPDHSCEGPYAAHCVTGAVCDLDYMCRMDLGRLCRGTDAGLCRSGTFCDWPGYCSHGVCKADICVCDSGYLLAARNFTCDLPPEQSQALDPSQAAVFDMEPDSHSGLHSTTLSLPSPVDASSQSPESSASQSLTTSSDSSSQSMASSADTNTPVVIKTDGRHGRVVKATDF
ncbi:hypothetical protein ACOMHN_041438 [Nucella lapillus]